MDYYNELYHHGILGMKWGVRRYQNKDGSLTDAGKKRYADAWRSNYQKSSYNDNPADTFKKSGLSGKKFEDIRRNISKNSDEILQCAKEAQELLKGLENQDEHARCASIAGIANGLGYSSFSRDMDNVASTMWFYTYEDGDQNSVNSNSVYVRDKGLLDKATALYKREQEAQNRYMEECKKMVNQTLGEYGNEPLNKYTTISSSIAQRMKNYDGKKIDNDTHYSSYRLAESCEWDRDNGSGNVDKRVAKATAIVNKIDCRKGNIWYMNEALENLDLSDVNMDDMTDTQWDMLNREMARINPKK